MTMQEINNTFATHSFSEAKAILRQEIQRLGGKVTGNETKLELIAKACEGPAETKTEDTKTTGSGGNPPAEQPSLPIPDAKAEAKAGEGAKADATPAAENPKAEPAPAAEGDAPDGMSAEEKAEEEARKAEEEARQKREELYKKLREAEDELRRKEEARKKAEEEARRKAEEEMRKKAEEEARRKAEEEKKRRVKKEAGAHKRLDELVETLQCTGQALLVGPAGTGKSTLAQSACCSLFNCKRNDETFNKHYAQISFSPDTTSGEMIGRVDVNGVFHESEVTRVYRDGGLILFDELDDADASLLVKLNTALANGVLVTPAGPVVRNPDTFIVCSANTYGTGPDAMYVGRNRLDAATLDRFVCATLEIDYDLGLERRLVAEAGLTESAGKWLLDGVKALRKVIKDNHLRRVCSTRFVKTAAAWLARGKDHKFILDRLFVGWSDTERNSAQQAFAA